MAIPAAFQGVEAYHFLHLDNLESVCRHGLLSCNEQQRKGVRHRSVALTGIQHRRAQMSVPVGPGGVVHDYVPFYFCKRSPMLLSVLNRKNVDQEFLVYLCIPVTVLEQQPCVFTDSSANRNDPPGFFNDPERLAELNWAEINSPNWKPASETLKQQKMAELLVYRQIEIARIPRVIVWDELVAKSVCAILDEHGLADTEIALDNAHYFTKPSAPDESLVTGPHFTKRQYKKTVARLVKGIGRAPGARFASLDEVRMALRRNLLVVPETAELVGLLSHDAMHAQDLGTHTRQVGWHLLALPEFQALDWTDQLITELAAYFHDIGKGPKGRWQASGGKYRPERDHPLRALPMLERILTEDVARMTRRSARLLCKLVCYHDLVGDVLGQGRDEQQLVEILDDSRELDMLIALSKANVLSIYPGWWHDAQARALRERVGRQLGVRKAAVKGGAPRFGPC